MSHDHLTLYSPKCAVALVVTCVCNVAYLFQNWFGIIKQLLPMSEVDMTICSPATGYIAFGLRPREISPAWGEQILMSPSLKGNNCIMSFIV